jgi:CRP/FNR family cyclic AMP-dependent transcriptional regulator
MEKQASLDIAFATLASRGWLADVSSEHRIILQSIASLRHASQDTQIFEIGSKAQGMIGVVSGSVKLAMIRPSGAEYTLFRPGPGFWVGHYAVLSDRDHLLSCTAAEPTVLVWLPKQPLIRLLEDNPDLHKSFWDLTYRHMANVLGLIAKITLQDSPQRVAGRLLAEHSGRSSTDGWIKLSQPELAEMLSMSVPTLQRASSRLVAANLIEIAYGRVRILDMQGLEAFSKKAI